MNLFTSFQSEILKTKGTASWYLTIIAASIFPLLLLLDASIDGVNKETLKDPLNIFFTEGFKGLNLLILPMYVILICTLLPQIEYRNNAWKQVFSSPHSIAGIYLAKYLNVQTLILLFFVVYNLSMGISAVAINYIEPSIGLFKKGMNWYQLWVDNVKTFLCISSVSVIQFVIGLRFKNFIAPIAIGFVMWVVGSLIVFEAPSSLARSFPFSYSVMIMFPKYKSLVPMLQWSSVGYAFLFLVSGYAFFNLKRIKG